MRLTIKPKSEKCKQVIRRLFIFSLLIVHISFREQLSVSKKPGAGCDILDISPHIPSKAVLRIKEKQSISEGTCIIIA